MDALRDKHYFLLAVVFYGLSTVYSIFLWKKGFRRHDYINYGLLFVAFCLHTYSMVLRGFSLNRCPVNNLYEALCFLMWTIIASYIAVGLFHRLRFLGAFAAPILFGIGVFALMPPLDPPHSGKPVFQTDWGSVHGALIMLSCGAFGLGAIAGAMFLFQEHDLKFHKTRAILSLLPPIQKLDRIMVGLMLSGVVLLTAGLMVSPLLLAQQRSQVTGHQGNPILELSYSALIWLVYVALILLRLRFAQGGRRFAWGVVGSFAFVLLTFWGFMLLSPLHKQ